MARKKPKRGVPASQLPPLTDLEQHVLAHLMTAIELGNFDEVATVEDLAKTFGRNPGRFRQVVNRLVRKGYVTVRGATLETVYPTVAALVRQKPSLSKAAAQKMLKKLGA